MNRMEKIYLNGKRMKNREQMHDHIRKRLHLPDYYGNNLDALYDCLTECGTEREIIVRNAEALRTYCADYGGKLLSVLAAATGTNPLLTVSVREHFFR